MSDTDPFICEETGRAVSEQGACPVHGGDGCIVRSDVLVARLQDRLREVVTTTRSKVSRIDTLLASNEPTTPEFFALPLKLCSRLIEYLDGVRAALSKENTE